MEVLVAVLLVVHHDEIRREPDHGGDVRVLGPADRRDAGLLAEPRARHRRHTQREERLGGGRDERDDAARVRGGRRHMRSSSCAFLRSNSSGVMWPWSRSCANCWIWYGMSAPTPPPCVGACVWPIE